MSDLPSDGGPHVADLDPPRFAGAPAERATAVAAHFADVIDMGGGPHPTLADPAARRWVETAMRLAADTIPSELAYVEATASARGFDVADLFAGLVPAAQRPASADEIEGCAVGARRRTGGGAWLVKNRDNRPDIRRRHIITHHLDPSWDGHAILATATAGGPTAASGGINTHGLCVVSTGTYLVSAPPGIGRSMLMGALLAGHRTVASALDLIADLPHLGGTLTLADATGAIATVDLHPEAVTIERPSSRGWVARTNHLCSTAVPAAGVPGPEFYRDSEARLARVGGVMASIPADGSWEEAWRTLTVALTSHDGPDALCRHEGDLQTISTAIFSTDPVAALVSLGPGCEGRWAAWTPDPRTDTTAP